MTRKPFNEQGFNMIKIELLKDDAKKAYVPCISEVEIATSAASYYYKQAEDKDFDLAKFCGELMMAVKSHLVRMEQGDMVGHIYRKPPHVFADRAAFYELAQIYNWDEEYTQTVLAELGEFNVSEAAA